MTRAEVLAARWLAAIAGLTTYIHAQAGRDSAAGLALLATIAALALLWLGSRGQRPAMSKPNKRRFKLETVRQVQADKRGSEIEIEVGEGEGARTFVMPAPGFWPDEAVALMGKGEEVKLAQALLGGTEQYASFVEAGGRAQDVALVISAYADEQGASTGESTASSSS
jgi:hypothetical protein